MTSTPEHQPPCPRCAELERRCAELELALEQMRIGLGASHLLSHANSRRGRRGPGKAAAPVHAEIRRRHFDLGQSYGVIADELNVNLETVKKVCQTMKRRMKKMSDRINQLEREMRERLKRQPDDQLERHLRELLERHAD